MNRIAPVIIILAAVFVSGGCARQELMQTPTVVCEGGINPFTRVIAERQSSTAPVFVASGRTLNNSATGVGDFYTNERSPVVRLGRADVQIGPGMTWAELTGASTAAKREQDPEIVAARITEYGVLWASVPPPSIHFDPDWDAPGGRSNTSQ